LATSLFPQAFASDFCTERGQSNASKQFQFKTIKIKQTAVRAWPDQTNEHLTARRAI